MICRPVLLRCDWTEAIPGRFAEEMDALIVGQDLEIRHPLIEHAAREGLTFSGLNGSANPCRRLSEQEYERKG